MRTLLIATAAAALLLAAGCAFMQKDNRRLLNALDDGVKGTWVAETPTGRIVASPVFLPVGLAALAADTVIVQPVAATGPAAKDMYDWIWKDPQGSDFSQVMLFLPKVVASPIVFVSDWLFRSVFATNL